MSRVSIIVPAYNQARYLGAAVQSALDQTFTDIEVIVVDDGSTDDTRDVVHRFSDPRLRYIHQDNSGLSAARNTGIRHARGAFLSYLDSDDQFLPHKIEVLLDAFEREPTLGFVAGHAVLIGERGEPLGERFERDVPADGPDWVLGNPLHVGSVMLRREWQERVGPFDQTLRSYEDWDMWIRLALAGCAMRSVRQLVSCYRFHGLQMTRVGRQMTTATFAVLDKTFGDPALPAAWRSRRDEAYSRGYLRAAAQAYTSREFAYAQDCMSEAVRLNPALGADGAEQVARLAAGWANHVKTAEPLEFLAAVYDHLPEALASLRRRRRRDLARQSLHLAFVAYEAGRLRTARHRFLKAASYLPHVVFTRSALPAFVRCLLSSGDPIDHEGRRVRQVS